jgi:hypothetical protein
MYVVLAVSAAWFVWWAVRGVRAADNWRDLAWEGELLFIFILLAIAAILYGVIR